MHVFTLALYRFSCQSIDFFLHVNDTQTKTGVGFAINGL